MCLPDALCVLCVSGNGAKTFQIRLRAVAHLYIWLCNLQSQAAEPLDRADASDADQIALCASEDHLLCRPGPARAVAHAVAANTHDKA